MKMKFAAILLSTWVIIFTDSAWAVDSGWLVGKWELFHDLDGDQKDWLEFKEDGQAFSISPNGRRVPGEYLITDSEVRVIYQLNGKKIPITFQYTPDRKKLLAFSKKTGNTSEYRKIE